MEPVKKIDDDGFLTETYRCLPGDWEIEANIGGKHGPRSRRFAKLSTLPVSVRQVPGDGNCLFHSISAGLCLALNGTHVCMRDITSLRSNSAWLRQSAVDCLSRNPRRLLFLQGNEYLRAKDLVDAAAAQYDMTGEKYCDLMRKDSYWGGGPEIVALCNVLKRPIHVYELTAVSEEAIRSDDNPKMSSSEGQSTARTATQFRLRRMACFGSPKFDRKEPLHILSADSRFPDVAPGRQMTSGNHFLAMFPLTKSAQKSAVVRGGGDELSAQAILKSKKSRRRKKPRSKIGDEAENTRVSTRSRAKKIRPDERREHSEEVGPDRPGRLLRW
eukprot:CAMPEP_0185727904 /NCGR_PEP_ID=MMETSP1171-20130828/3448_1 /TAXON_ID=374046 /ORGANISM="Helicotheca tamensis, Strain CCMP826" /LENGTH=328 /DNA_ID=CAMNT_0028396549 /DNA_START=228 /DNA_END=1212 /DNA_ORIENTATION=-